MQPMIHRVYMWWEPLAGNVSIIRPASDTVVTTLPAPQQSFGCATPNACPATPQIPFSVRVFP